MRTRRPRFETAFAVKRKKNNRKQKAEVMHCNKNMENMKGFPLLFSRLSVTWLFDKWTFANIVIWAIRSHLLSASWMDNDQGPSCVLTVNNLNIWINRSEQTVQSQIRLLLMERSDQGLHCFPFLLRLLGGLLHCKIKLFHFVEWLW